MKVYATIKSIVISTSMLCFGYANAYTVGIALPTQTEERWYTEGKLLDTQLQQAGFKTELFYAGELSPELQKRQLSRLINQKVDLMIVTPVDDDSLVDVLSPALEKNIPVISYDRLIKNTDAVTYYASVDNDKVGQMQGRFIIDKIKPDSGDVKNIEIFSGSEDDSNAQLFYQGAMKALSGFIVLGYINIKSEQSTFEDTSIDSWSGELANKRMNELIDKIGYGPDGVKLDAVLTPNDTIADGVLFALKRRGYTAENMPVITGCDSTPMALNHIKKGEQGMTIYKSKELCNTVVQMVKDISQGRQVAVTDNYTYDNGYKIMDSVLCKPEMIDITNQNFLTSSR
ncbi:MAG: sugar-binding protein [Succinivibrio sp.]